ncbi:MAG: hypothetical protein U0800_03260 [Isosphaeraceae bacterium]
MMGRTLLKATLSVAAGCWLLSSGVGCVHSKSQARPSSQSQEIPSLIDPDEDSPMGTRTLIKGANRASRSPGGWSSQANEIEDHLGVR